MATLSSVIETLRDINEEQKSFSVEHHVEIKESLSEIASAIGKSRGLGLPSLPSLSNIVTNNPISKMIRGVKDSIASVISAPFRILSGAIEGLKSTVLGTFSKIGSLFMAPFKFLRDLIIPSNRRSSDPEMIKILSQIRDGVYESNLGINRLERALDSYLEYLVNQNLDELEKEREQRKTERRSGPRGPGSGTPDSQRTSFNFFGGLGGLLSGLGTAGGFAVALGVELLGLDDFAKALFLPETFERIKNGFKGVGKFLGSLGNLFPEIKIPNLGISSSVGKAMEGVKSFFSSFSGFFSKTFSLLKTVSAPLRLAANALKAIPGLNLFLTAFDGLFGAIKGFLETEGTFGQKLLGAVEGAALGIVKGITGAIDLVAFKIPAWILKKLGFERASELIGNLSLTTLVEDLWSGIKSGIKSLFTDGIQGLGATLKNIPDQLYLAAQKYLRIEIPEISIGLPDWLGGGKFTLIPSFSAGFGSEEGAAQARANIDSRNREILERQRVLERESSTRLERSQGRLNEAMGRSSSAVSANVQNNVDARNTQNNTTFMNQGAFPPPVDGSDPVRQPI